MKSSCILQSPLTSWQLWWHLTNRWSGWIMAQAEHLDFYLIMARREGEENNNGNYMRCYNAGHTFWVVWQASKCRHSLRHFPDCGSTVFPCISQHTGEDQVGPACHDIPYSMASWHWLIPKGQLLESQKQFNDIHRVCSLSTLSIPHISVPCSVFYVTIIAQCNYFATDFEKQFFC